MATGNSVNENTPGIVGFTGTAWTGTAATNHAVLVGGATSSTLTNVSPSATSGIPLISQGSSSDPAFGTAVVAGGGTGNTTFTAYSIIAAGTSSTGAFQNVSGLGSSGQVLTSNGAGALPTWQAASAGSAFTTVVRQYFTADGTYTPTSGMKYCIIECYGGGGGGGGCGTTGAGQVSVGGGGGGGGYSNGVFTAADIGASKAVTIGGSGTGGANTGGTGGTGGTTSVGVLITALGGTGGAGTAAGTTAAALGGASGFGTGTSLSIFGCVGTNGVASNAAAIGIGGTGGGCAGSGGNKGGAIAGSGGSTGTGGSAYGGGGGGSVNLASQSGRSGGAGGAGAVIITEFI